MRKTGKRCLSLLLAAGLLAGLLLPLCGVAYVELPGTAALQKETVPLSAPITVTPNAADQTVQLDFAMTDSANLMPNGGFESGLDGWVTWNGGSLELVTGEAVPEGAQAAKMDAASNGVKQAQDWTNGLTPNAVYTLSAYAKTEGETEGKVAWVTLDAKNAGGQPTTQYILEFNETEWTQKTQTFRLGENAIAFNMTTWIDERSPEILYLDGVTLTKKVVTADGHQYFYSDERAAAAAPETGAPRPAAYSHVLTSGDSLPRTGGDFIHVVEVDAHDNIVAFAALTVPGKRVVGIRSVAAQNGEAVVTLDSAPEQTPVQSDFSLTFTSSAQPGETALPITGFAYDAASCTATLSFAQIEKKDAEQEITVTAQYGEASAAAPAFTVESIHGPTVTFWTESSNVNVFRDDTQTAAHTQTLSFTSAVNEFESAQIVLRATGAFTITGVTFSDLTGTAGAIGRENFKYNYVEYESLTGNSSGQNASTVVRPAPGWFPEALSNEASVAVEKNAAQPVWVRLYTPKGTGAGVYSGTAVVHTTAGDFSVPVQAKVYDVTLPEPSEGEFGFSFWSNIAGLWDLNDENDQIAVLYGYERWSDDWWALVGDIAQLMKDNRSNNLYINPVTLVKDGPGTRLDENGVYHFDWSRFDEYIEYFIEKGVVKNLEGMTLLSCVYGSDYNVYTLTGELNQPLRHETLGFSDPRSQAWLEQFIPAYVDHITEKGWDEIWIQHIGDEPFDVPAQVTKWGAVRDMIRARNPKIRCGDAVDNGNAFSAVQKLNSDIYFPILSVHESSVERCDELRAQGKEVYMYTCLNPQGGYLNRYVDKPVWQMKTIGWLSYLRGATGHLHWGFNEWFRYQTDIFQTIPLQSYKGDNFTIHPDVDAVTQPDGTLISSTPRRPKVKSSIRYEAVRDACEDYEIFKILEQRDRDLAKEIAGSLVTNGTSFSTDVDEMLRQRERLLAQASLAALSAPLREERGDQVGETKFVFDALPAGRQYFYRLTEDASDPQLEAMLIGQAKPAAYAAQLVSGAAVKADNGMRLNVVEVDADGLVRAYATVTVKKSRLPMAYSVPVRKEIALEPTAEEHVYDIVFETELGKEKILNRDFEAGAESWNNIKNFTVKDGTGTNGSKSAVVGMPEGGSQQMLATPLLPETQYYFAAMGKVSKTGELGWTTVESENRNIKIDLEFSKTEYKKQEAVFTTPERFSGVKVLTWKNDAAYGGMNDTYFYADDLTLRSMDVEVGDGHVYYAMSDRSAKAADLEVGTKRPEAFDVLLRKGSTVTLQEDEYLNIVEVDENDKVAALTCLTLRPETIPVESVSLNAAEKELTVGDTFTLQASVLPEDASDPSVRWTSSDESVASVDADGTVRAKQAGTAVITATTEDGAFTASCTVTVKAASGGSSEQPGSSEPPAPSQSQAPPVSSGTAASAPAAGVQTGDPTPVSLLAVLLLASGAGLAGLVFCKRKKEQR